ncbi:MAG: hypothetical protein VW683_01580 [Betaproteobacteria bacterium]|jgi:hypothetical protein
MKRFEPLPFEWVRDIWVSQEVKTNWQPILQNLCNKANQVEVTSVYERVKMSFLGYESPSGFPALEEKAKRHGLVIVKLQDYEMNPDQSYFSAGISNELTGKYPVKTRYALTTPELEEAWIAAYVRPYDYGLSSVEANRIIGELLSYPDCCIDFFNDVWIRGQYIDTTWQQAVNTIGEDYMNWENEDRVVQVNQNPYTTQLGRWYGCRIAYHLPCKFDCKPSIALGKQMESVWRSLGWGDDFDMLHEVLSWPMEWSALHGIAEIKTPIHKISTRTDSTFEKYTVQGIGERYPEDGAKGIMFPYKKGPAKIYTHRSFKESIMDPSLWEENGFSTNDAMESFHNVVLDSIKEVQSEIPDGDVLDLGSGNGWLLKRVHDLNINWIPNGVEVNDERYLSSLALIPFGNTTHGQISNFETWPEETYSMILLMPGRVIEMQDQSLRDEFITKLHEKTEFLVLNLTDDWTQMYETPEWVDQSYNPLEACLGDAKSVWKNLWVPMSKFYRVDNNICQVWRRR